MHEDLVPFLNQILFTLAMLAAWTATKVDDTFVKILQIVIGNKELTDLVHELFDEMQPKVPLAGTRSAAAGDLAGIAQQFQSVHDELTTKVQERFSEGVRGAGKDAKAKAIVENAGIDWQKWLSYLPLLLQILAMFKK